MFRRNTEMDTMVARLNSLENVYGSVVPRIASVEHELRSFVVRMQAVETQMGRERQRRQMAADEEETSGRIPIPSAPPLAIVGHRGPGTVMPLPAPAPALTDAQASTSPVPLLVSINTPDNASQRAASLPAPALHTGAGFPHIHRPHAHRVMIR